jgi:nucleoside-triphosphatase
VNSKIFSGSETAQRKKNILVTGLPGVGKTTLIIKLAQKLRDLRPVGFYTEEIRDEGTRKGFEIQCFDGQKGLLSHIDLKGPHRVGKYGVDVRGFERFLYSIPFSVPETGLVIIDEIGRMECLSSKFRKLIAEILGSEKMLIASIALKGSGLIAEIKARPDVQVYEITEKNRDDLLAEILQKLDFRFAGLKRPQVQ